MNTAFGWVIEYRHDGTPMYLSLVNGTLSGMLYDPCAAIRFARKQDAEQILTILRYEMSLHNFRGSMSMALQCAVVCEHGWDE